MANVLAQGVELIPDQQGFLMISDDGMLASSGDLDNDERVAGVLMALVSTASKFPTTTQGQPPFRRLTVVFGEFSYVLTTSAGRVFVVKRRNAAPELPTA
ncbi:ragulator complex protein LAMTOR4-like [Lampetra fluviatilis]